MPMRLAQSAGPDPFETARLGTRIGFSTRLQRNASAARGKRLQALIIN
jgi:hypothetical protein